MVDLYWVNILVASGSRQARGTWSSIWASAANGLRSHWICIKRSGVANTSVMSSGFRTALARGLLNHAMTPHCWGAIF
eukprot:2625143-Pyramimonas_sp.AAC.1